MDDTKHPLRSLGIVGPLAAILVIIANHLKPGLGLTSDAVAPAIDGGDAIIGCILGIVGRWRATKRISVSALAALCVATALSISACSSSQIQQAGADADSAVASAQPTIELACWLAQAADAGFQAYVATQEVTPAVLADEQKAMAGANAICASPPADLAQAIVDVMAAYKAVVAATPPTTVASGT